MASLLFERTPHTPTEEPTASLDEITCRRLIASADVLTKKKKKKADDRQIRSDLTAAIPTWPPGREAPSAPVRLLIPLKPKTWIKSGRDPATPSPLLRPPPPRRSLSERKCFDSGMRSCQTSRLQVPVSF